MDSINEEQITNSRAIHGLSGPRTLRWFAGMAFVGLLAACGGGGQTESAGSELSAARENEAKKKADPDPTLAAQPVSVVNTTIAGDQSLKTIGALADGGYTVAWISGSTLYMQRHDSAGNKSGSETVVPVVLDPRDNASIVLAGSSMAVLTDGSVVVAYRAARNFEQPPIILTDDSVYMQRFDANGVQVLPETQVVSRVEQSHSRSPSFGVVKALAMTDGGFVIGWRDFTPSATVGSRNGFHTKRFDSQHQAVGGTVLIGGGIESSYELTADAHGGYTAHVSQLDPNNLLTRLLTVTHYDANQSATQIVASTTGSALLLHLEDGRYVLYTTDAGSAYRQMLDSAGNPVGDRTAVSSMPASAQELVDGSYVVFWSTSGGTTAQRFDSSGAPMGDVLTVQTSGAQAAVVALAESGFAAAWSAASTAGDLDVYTQRFIEVADNQRKACLASAKGLRGQERKAFMEACVR